MIKAVIFDLDDTLFDFTGAHKLCMPALVAYAQKELGMSEELFLAETKRLLKEQLSELREQAGAHSRAIRYQRLLEQHRLPLRHAAVLNDLYWNTMLGMIKPFPHAVELLRSLREQGITIGLGSDMTADWQLKKLEAIGLLEYFSFIVTSEECAEKPSPKMFSLCTQKAGCAPSECVFIGDNLIKDIQGALAFGMKAIWLQPSAEEAAKHPEIRSGRNLAEVSKLLTMHNA